VRDVERTVESERLPRFVLLEHVWNGVHWDLMLESGEMLRTWAIDEPVVANRELPARALADHRRMYLDYEGEVSGGRGQVRRLDAGTFKPLIWSPEHVRIEIAGSQLAGAVDLRLRLPESGGTSSWTFWMGNLD
jgi:hypothetical protein